MLEQSDRKNVSNVKRDAIKVLRQTDELIDTDKIKTIAQAMTLLSEYAGGYSLFGQLIESATTQDCIDLIDSEYQSKRLMSDRKSKGRHYTPLHMARSVAKTALDIPLPQKVKDVSLMPFEEQLNSMLEFSTCDIACGSGIFLMIAANRIGIEVAKILSRGNPVTADHVEFGRLLASEHCIYGVDLDPLAVELCKLTLWLNATLEQRLIHLPLPPLSNIRCGDSLVGVSDLTVLRSGIPDGAYKAGGSFYDKEIARQTRARNKKERLAFQVKAGAKSLELMRDACNVWVAAFFARLQEGSLIPTTFTLQCVLNNEIPKEQQAIVDWANQFAQKQKFFHWAVEFPHKKALQLQ